MDETTQVVLYPPLKAQYLQFYLTERSDLAHISISNRILSVLLANLIKFYRKIEVAPEINI